MQNKQNKQDNNEQSSYDLYSKTLRFNTLAGKLAHVTMQDVLNQEKRITEEYKEFIFSLQNGNAVGALDGLIDMLVTCHGALQQMQVLGCDVQGAMQTVAEDNISKFPTNAGVAYKTRDYYAEQGINVTVQQADGCFVIKDENQKVRKPFGYRPLDLSQFVSERAVQEFAEFAGKA